MYTVYFFLIRNKLFFFFSYEFSWFLCTIWQSISYKESEHISLTHHMDIHQQSLYFS